MSISLRSNADGSGTLLNGSTPVMEITAAGVVSLPNIAAGSSANQPVNLGQFIGTNVSLSTNGYQKLPSGLIIQWGSVISYSADSQVTWTFPIAFPIEVFNVQVTDMGPSYAYTVYGTISTSSIKVATPYAGSIGIFIVAIGR